MLFVRGGVLKKKKKRMTSKKMRRMLGSGAELP
jgi:hypothetical protein